MKGSLLLKIQVLLAIVAICSGQLIMGTPLGNQFSQTSFNDSGDISEEDLQKIMEMEQIEEEIEDSLTKAEGVIEGLHTKIENNELQPTDDEMFIALKESVAKLHEDQEQSTKKSLSKDIQIAKNLIGESALDEISDEIKENYFFKAGDRNTQDDSTLEEKQASIENKKKEIQEMIQTEKSWLRTARNKLKGIEDVPEHTKFTEEAKKKNQRTNELVNAQKRAVKKIESIVNKHIDGNTNDTTEVQQFELEKNIADETANTSNPAFLSETINSIFGNAEDEIWDTEILNQSNIASIIEEDGKKLDSLKEEYTDEETELQLEQDVDELLKLGDKLHNKFVDDSTLLETLIGTQKQPVQDESTLFDFDEESQLLPEVQITQPEVSEERKVELQLQLQQDEKLKVEGDIEQKKKEEEDEERSTFFKQIVFSIVVVLAILFMIFGSQFDLFSFFSQRRRAKDPFYRDDEAQQSLLN